MDLIAMEQGANQVETDELDFAIDQSLPMPEGEVSLKMKGPYFTVFIHYAGR